MSDEFKFQKGLYYRKDGDGPFCPGCKDGNSKIVRLVKVPHKIFIMFKFRFECPVCKSKFG